MKKGAWARTADAAALAETATAKRIVRPQTRDDRRLANNRAPRTAKRNLGSMQRVLDMGAAGAPLTLIAKRIGMSRDGLDDWLKSDVEFRRLFDAAQADRALTRVEALDSAAERGDWRAAAWLLERDAATRDDFRMSEAAGAGAGQIAVQVVLPADLAAVLSQPWTKTQGAPVLDHAPLSADDGDDASPGETVE
jgi:hypothetical protein